MDTETEQEKLHNYMAVNANNYAVSGLMTDTDAMSFAIRKALTGETWFICRVESKVEPHVKITDYPKQEN